MLEGKGRDEFKEFAEDRENPEYVVIGDNRSCFDFHHLNHALRALRNGARLIGMQSELVDTSMGEVELNVGSWVGMLERASSVSATYIGKPNPYAFELCLGTMKLKAQEVIMIGDRVSTDITGASELGLLSVLVKTGEFSPTDLNAEIHPNYVIDCIRDLPSILQDLSLGGFQLNN